MGDVVNLPRPAHVERAATCGCGGQTFILVVDGDDRPDFVYCTDCQHRQSRIGWVWHDDIPPAA